MEQVLTEFAGLGIAGIIGGYLFTTFMRERSEERKISLKNQIEDRELYRKSVEAFTETSKAYVDSIENLTSRIESVENKTGRIELKIDKLIEKAGA